MKRGTTTMNLKPFMKVEVRIKIEVSIGILISLKVCYKSRKKHQKEKKKSKDLIMERKNTTSLPTIRHSKNSWESKAAFSF